jgi:hypothetical protein
VTLGIIEPYFWGLLISLNWMASWEYTTLKVKFLKLWLLLSREKAEVYTPQDFDNYVCLRWGLLGELLSCPICLSHWVGALTSTILCYFFECPFYLVILSFFTYPIIIYSFMNRVIKH